MPLSKIQTIGNQVIPNLGRRNLVINGGMKVAQRGTVTGITSGAYAGPDRILWTNGSLGTWTISQSTDVPSGEGFSHSWKVDCTSATSSPGGGAYAAPSYNFEGQDLQGIHKGTSSAKKLTVSFYVKSNKTGTYIGELRDHDNNRHISKTWTINSANTWERKILTFDADTTGALDNDVNNSFTFYWYLGAGTNFTSGTLATSWASLVSANRAAGLNVNLGDNTSNEIYITGLQIEIGDTATDFEHRSFAEELDLCERYFQTYSNRVFQGTNEHAANYFLYLDGAFRKRMRAAPTATFTGTVIIARPQVAVTQRPNSLGNLSDMGFMSCNWPTSGTYGGQLGSHGDAYYRMSVSGAGNSIDFSAEL